MLSVVFFPCFSLFFRASLLRSFAQCFSNFLLTCGVGTSSRRETMPQLQALQGFGYLHTTNCIKSYVIYIVICQVFTSMQPNMFTFSDIFSIFAALCRTLAQKKRIYSIVQERTAQNTCNNDTFQLCSLQQKQREQRENNIIRSVSSEWLLQHMSLLKHFFWIYMYICIYIYFVWSLSPKISENSWEQPDNLCLRKLAPNIETKARRKWKHDVCDILADLIRNSTAVSHFVMSRYSLLHTGYRYNKILEELFCRLKANSCWGKSIEKIWKTHGLDVPHFGIRWAGKQCFSS